MLRQTEHITLGYIDFSNLPRPAINVLKYVPVNSTEMFEVKVPTDWAFLNLV